ncbi:MarR family winged helix-turn-helix transcriptional regulator [Dactylosporangium sp. CA-233914]|uniref:MarR family winged helix-turn-helix transcriptional regulator n=1 Tax=Dactylosporangium sp. CA-233914 TaxID=3239934 RepID=UPI003D8F261E
MPRPAAHELASAGSVDLSPARRVDPGGLLASLGAIVHWSDSHDVRVSTMKAAGFPVDDVVLFLAVNQLAYRGALRPTELARALGTGRSNMTKITRRLEEADLILRTADPADDRGVLIALSSRGRDIGEKIIGHAEQRLRESLDDWPRADREELRRLLAKLADAAIADGYQPIPHAGSQPPGA